MDLHPDFEYKARALRRVIVQLRLARKALLARDLRHAVEYIGWALLNFGSCRGTWSFQAMKASEERVHNAMIRVWGQVERAAGTARLPKAPRRERRAA